jgi:hypothetical protein
LAFDCRPITRCAIEIVFVLPSTVRSCVDPPRDELLVVLDVGEGVVDPRARGVDERPVVELHRVVLLRALLPQDEVLRLVPIDRGFAAAEREKREAEDRRPERHGRPPC